MTTMLPRTASTPKSARSQSASLQFFGASEDKPTISPWFNPEDLNAPDFNAANFVTELRQYAPLESLAEELKNYLATLKAKLVEVINEDYNDFVSLSTKLVGVDASVLRMQRLLQDVGGKLASVKNELQEELDALQAGLAKRQEIATARTLLELMQNSAHTMSKVESLLAEIEHDESQNEAQSLDNRCRMLERLASEISRLNFYTAKGEDLPFIQQMKPQMIESTEKLQFRLAAALKSALVENDDSSRQHCLLAYGYINDSHGAEKVVRDVKIRPLVSIVIDSHSSGPLRSSDTFPKIVEELKEKAEDILAPLLAATSTSESSSQTFCFLGNSLLAEVDDALGDRLSGALAPGMPDSFAVNYKAAMKFLDGLELMCTSTSSLFAFRKSQAFSSFLKRWKLSIYFSTRFQEVAGTLETLISGNESIMLNSEEENSLSFQLAPSLTLTKCMQRAISDDVYLPSLKDKFLKLLFQLMARYRNWLKIGSSPSDSSSDTPRERELRLDWTEGAKSDILASAQSDLDILIDWLQNFISSDLESIISSNQPEVENTVKEVLQNSIEDLASESENIVGSIVRQISEKCCSNLSQLRGITAMYRMSTRPPPSRPSHYVNGLLNALKDFFELANSQSLNQAAKIRVSKGVLRELMSRFCSKASELLDTLRKTENSLNRIRQNRSAEQTAAGGMTDIEKISTQLFLDVQELGRQAKNFEVDVSELSEYQELWKVVAPADKATIQF